MLYRLWFESSSRGAEGVVHLQLQGAVQARIGWLGVGGGAHNRSTGEGAAGNWHAEQQTRRKRYGAAAARVGDPMDDRVRGWLISATTIGREILDSANKILPISQSSHVIESDRFAEHKSTLPPGVCRWTHQSRPKGLEAWDTHNARRKTRSTLTLSLDRV
jgi:hypothetical protein